MTRIGRLKRSVIYALVAVLVSTAFIFVLLSLGNRATQGNGTSLLDVAAYVLGFPLLLGWIVSTAMFGSLGSCATPTQILGVFLTPVISFPLDAGLIFAVWEFFHRKASRGLESESVLHIK